MVNDTALRWILTTLGLCVMILILLSNSSTTSKGVGVFLGVLLTAMGIIATGPLKKYFQETREGNMNPNH